MKETFYLICDERQEFAYHSWIGERFPNLKQFYTVTPRDTTIIADSISILQHESVIEPSIEISGGFN